MLATLIPNQLLQTINHYHSEPTTTNNYESLLTIIIHHYEPRPTSTNASTNRQPNWHIAAAQAHPRREDRRLRRDREAWGLPPSLEALKWLMSWAYVVDLSG